MIRFGKSAGPLLAHKTGFFSSNDELLAEGNRIGAIYTRQPRRAACKVCAGPLDGARFTKQDIEYVLCARCGHLNGAHEDTAAFCDAVYTGDDGASYAKNYSAADTEAYRARVRDIYSPKVAFLREALAEQGETPENLTYADFGAGSGYMVAAMRQAGCHETTGYEVSRTQVALAEAMIAPGAVVRHALDEATGLAERSAADVVTMIGVLEHLQKPREMLAAVAANPKTRYLFISVPLFSPCVMLEAVFPNVMQRQLSAGHTHLFTESSLDWLCKEFGMTRAAEWWFGTDIVDLFRSVAVELERNAGSRALVPVWRDMIAPAIDDMQGALDTRKLASEVHMLFKLSTART